MSEQQYIDATNLAKLRILLNIARDVLPMRVEEQSKQVVIRAVLCEWITYLEPVVAGQDSAFEVTRPLLQTTATAIKPKAP